MMATSKFDPQRFFAEPAAVAAVATADELFGFLSRKVNLPPGVAALVTRRQGDHQVCPDGGELNGDNATEVLFVRTRPVELSWTEERITSADKFQATATIELQVTPVAERGEMLGFRKEILGSNRQADRDTLVRYLRSAVRQGLTRAAQQRDMDLLVDAKDHEAVAKAVADAVAGLCFEAGLMADPTPNVRFESSTLGQVRQAEEQTARKRQEHSAKRQLEKAIETAQQDHLQHLQGLLDKLKTLAADSPDVELADVIRTFSESQRGEIYEALFAASTDTPVTQWIVVAAGDELLFYDPASAQSPTRQVSLGGEVGPVRSVQSVHGPDTPRRLMAGAARGVYEVNPEGEAAVTTFSLGPGVEVRGGVNSVAVAGERVWATHSEIGLVRWSRTEPDNPERLLENLTRNAQAVRGVQFRQGKVYCSVDHHLLVIDADQPTEDNLRTCRGSDSLITSICPTPDGIYAGNAEGQILFWPHDDQSSVRIIHSGSRRPAESLHLLILGGISRLFFTDTSLAVHARVIGDSFACRYEAGGQTLRRVEVAPDLLVATNELRDRLILWKPDKPDTPIGTIGVARQTTRHIQDVCLPPQA
jgi:hypothetical protein